MLWGHSHSGHHLSESISAECNSNQRLVLAKLGVDDNSNLAACNIWNYCIFGVLRALHLGDSEKVK